MLLRHRRVYALQQPTDSTSPLHSVSCFLPIGRHITYSYQEEDSLLSRCQAVRAACERHVWNMRVAWHVYGSPHPLSHPAPTWCLCSCVGLCEWHPLYSVEQSSQTRAISGSILLSSSMSLRCTTGPAVPVYCRAWSWWRLQWTNKYKNQTGRDGTGCEFDSCQCRIYIPCSLNLRLTQKLF